MIIKLKIIYIKIDLKYKKAVIKLETSLDR